MQTAEGGAFAIEEGDVWSLLTAAPWLEGQKSGRQIATTEAVLLAPVAPSKVICVGRNYRAHAAELGNAVPVEPMLFFKPPSSIVGPGAPIELPAVSERVDHEAELGVVIGRRCRRLSRDEVPGVIAGYTCVNDVTARDLQKRDGQWARAKGFDSFCPVGPFVVTGGFDPSAAEVICRVDGAIKQQGKITDMIFSVTDLLVYISQIFTLEPGDLIVTGTPEGVSPLAPGQVVEVEITGLGTLSNPVRAAG